MTRNIPFGMGRGFDSFLAILIGIWFSGGVEYQGHLYLKHGADPRRMAILVGVAGWFLFPALRRKSIFLRLASGFGKLLKDSRFRCLVLLGMIAFVTALSIQQALAMRTTLYDVGIFHQILWSLSKGLGFHSTISGAGNFLQDHLSPSLLFLVPFFRAGGESPLFLSILQPLLLLGGGGAWIYLAARMPGVSADFRATLAAATTVFVFGFDSLWGNYRWGFHENAIGFFCLSWALAILLSSEVRTGLRSCVVLFLLLAAAGSKEILLCDVAFALGYWAYSERKNRIFSGFLFIVAASLIGSFWYFEKMSHPADKNYFVRYYSYLGQDLNGFLSSFWRAPILFIQTIGLKELLKYFFIVFSPWLFLPFLGPLKTQFKLKLRMPSPWLLMIVPSFASAALATYSPLRDSRFHYVLELWPCLAVLSLFSLAQIQSKYLVWAWALLALLRMDHDPLADYREYLKRARSLAPLRNKIQEIPNDASVSAGELAGTWISSRKWVMRWPQTFLLPEERAQFVLIQDGRVVDESKYKMEWTLDGWSLFQHVSPNLPVITK